MSEDKVTRRNFLWGTLAAGIGLVSGAFVGCKSASSHSTAATGSPRVAQAPAPAQVVSNEVSSRVIHLNSANAFSMQTGQADYQTVKNMLQTGICHFTGDADATGAWKRLVKPTDRIGIKINCLGRPAFVNNTTLLRVLKEELMAAGVAAQNIIVFDRYTSHLTGGGFTIGQQPDGTWLKATDGGGPGYDNNVTQSFQPASGGRSESAPLSKIVSQQITKLINIPILKDHGSAGVTLALKNIAFGVFSHTKSAHQNNCTPYIPAMNQNPVVRQKTILTVLDGLKGQYAGGPGGKPQFQFAQGSLLMGKDPVAIDALGAGLINQTRQQNGKGPISDQHIKHIFTAAQMGLGCADQAQIEEVLISI